jgi:hypothetical protein
MTGRAFVVERINWVPTGKHFSKCFHLLPGAVRVACFDDAATAETDCRRREAEARAEVNPFTCGGPALHYLTSLDEGRLRDWLLDAGLAPPEPGVDWWRWWEWESATMTDVQQAKVWEALDKVRFFPAIPGE